MARCLCCVTVVWFIWAVAASERVSAERPLPPVLIWQAPQPQLAPSVAEAPSLHTIVESAGTPAEMVGRDSASHLRLAADHVEAAAVGEHADELCELAEDLRRKADDVERETAERIAQLQREIANLQSEIRRLGGATTRSQQVHVDMQIIEVDLDAIESLGFEAVFTEASGEDSLTVRGAGRLLGTASASADEADLVPKQYAASMLDALRKEGLVRVIANPKLVTTSGRPANIHSGGEFPVVVPQSTDAASIEWREFGIRAEVIPMILANGKLRLDIAPEVSERDFSNAVTVDGMVVPGITTRRINTQVEMEFGQTAVIGGVTLTDYGEGASDDCEALVGVPVPGQDRAFRQVAHEEKPKRKTLVVLVTPTLVQQDR